MTDSTQTAIITGANSGLGLHCARLLLADDPSWHVVLAVRDPARGEATAAQVRDPNFRVQVSPLGLHVYNRDGHHIAADPFALFDKLGVAQDGAHAFYLGYELAKAEIARALGKRYAQDTPLDWGVAADRKQRCQDDAHRATTFEASDFRPGGSAFAAHRRWGWAAL